MASRQDIDDEIKAEQLLVETKNLRLAVISIVPILVIFDLIFRQSAGDSVMNIWLACFIGTAIPSGIFGALYQNRILQNLLPFKIIYRLMQTISTLFGLTWGLTGWILFPYNDQIHNIILSYFIWGLIAGLISPRHSRFTSNIIIAIIAMAPITIRFALDGQPLSAEMAGVNVVLTVSIAFFSWNSQQSFLNSMDIRFQNRELNAALNAENEMAVAARNQAQQANMAKTRFLASASHDLRQPLQAAHFLSEALSVRLTEPRDKKLVTQMIEATGSATDLLNRLLDASKIDAGIIKPDIGPVDLADMLANVRRDIEMRAAARNIKLRVAATSAFAKTDAVLLENIVKNLAVNAIRYTDGDKVLIGCRPWGGSILVQVWDSGPGISEEDHEKIFEEFVKLQESADREGGLGLGLFIVKRLCETIGAPVTLRSSVGSPTCFSLELERIDRPMAAIASGHGIAPTFAGRHALVLDDHQPTREGLAALLSGWGFAVTEVESMAALVDLDLIAIEPDLALVDLRLEGEATGLDAVEHMRKTYRNDMKAIVVTGDTSPQRLTILTNSGLPFAHKPVAPAALRSLIQSQIPPTL